MPKLIGENRNQLVLFSLETAASHDAFVRVADAFVDAINLESFNFTSFYNTKFISKK